MIFDKLDLLADAQALTSTGNLTNVIDLVAAGLALPDGEPLELVIKVDVAADGTTTDETYAFDVVTSAAAALTSPTSLGKRTLTYGQLVAGSTHHIPLSPGAAMLRYLGVIATLGGTTPSVTITAFIQPMNMGNDVPKHFASGSVIA